MKKDITAILQELVGNTVLVGSNNPSTLMPFTNRIVETFQYWLLKQAEHDSKRNYRQTKAFELYERLRDKE